MDATLEKVYAVDLPNRTPRDPGVPMSVICCGMSRTGTTSLKNALEILGIGEVYHGAVIIVSASDCAAWVQAVRLREQKNKKAELRALLERILGNYGAIADIPAALFAEELLELYPDAKVVLNTRETEPWLRSMQGGLAYYLSGRKWFELFDSTAFWGRRYVETNFVPMYEGDFDGNARKVFEEHNRFMKRLVPKHRLLEWRVEDGWEPVCRHLGMNVPDVPFPRGNSSKEVSDRTEAKERRLRAQAWRRIAVGLVGVGGIAATVIRLYTGRWQGVKISLPTRKMFS